MLKFVIRDGVEQTELIGTCKLNRVEPYAYLKDVPERLPSHPMHRPAELLPFNWKPACP